MRAKKYTEVYLIRHSEQERIVSDDMSNEEIPLSKVGVEKAKELANIEELQKIDVIYSSPYKRAVQTAEYIANKNELQIKINPYLGERKLGSINEVIRIVEETGNTYTLEQLKNPKLKASGGESLQEVHKRMSKLFNEIIMKNQKKRIVFVSHGTAIKYLILDWCRYDKVTNTFTYKGMPIISHKFSSPEILKLTFDEDIIMNFERIFLI